jgi:polyisoprenoid-binding protein YceI
MAWVIDSAHTTVGFSARHLGLSTVRGQFCRFSGTLDIDPGDLTKTTGRVEIDASSIDTGNEQRDGHLRSPDFLDVERFPTITFEPTEITMVGRGEFTIRGNLTIKDVTRPVELRYEHGGEVKDPFGNRKLGGTLTGVIRRSEWGLTWNVALESGGWLVSENVKIEVDGQVAESQEVVDQEVEAEMQPQPS